MASGGLTIVWFLVIVALIPLTLWALKRSGLANGTLGTGHNLVKTINQLNIGPGQRVVTVEVGSGDQKTWLVLGVTAQQINTLHTMAPQALPESGQGQGVHPAFAALLRRTTESSKENN